MYYIIMDLEWNNTYGSKIKGFINEIIEIGAVMLDENYEQVDTFSRFIKAQIGKKLRGSVKKLTNITNDDIISGSPFTNVLAEFRRWIGNRDNVVLTWGDGDVRVLIENCRYLNGINNVPFLTKYADLQKYFQQVFGTSSARQIGLGTAAEMLDINYSSYILHRALDDSMLTAEIFRRISDMSDFEESIKVCDECFYSRLAFKPHVIGNIDNPLVDKSNLSYICEKCGRKARRVTDWKFSNRYFRALFYCPDCDISIRVGVSFKKLYDRVEVKKTSIVVVEHSDGEDEKKYED